jgi:hypothetical protein
MKSLKIDMKIKKPKMPKLLKKPKEEKLGFAIKLPVDRKASMPWVKFPKI